MPEKQIPTSVTTTVATGQIDASDQLTIELVLASVTPLVVLLQGDAGNEIGDLGKQRRPPNAQKGRLLHHRVASGRCLAEAPWHS